MPRILIVDDSALHRELGAVLLTQGGGHTILEAENGLEAIRMAQDEFPDLILMDLSMPEMDGVTAMHRLRATDATRHIPIVAITGYPEQWAREVTQGGFQGYIEKPFRPSTFVEDVLAHLCQTDHRLH